MAFYFCSFKFERFGGVGKEEPGGRGQGKFDCLPMNFNAFRHHLFSESFASGEEAQQLCIGCFGEVMGYQ